MLNKNYKQRRFEDTFVDWISYSIIFAVLIAILFAIGFIGGQAVKFIIQGIVIAERDRATEECRKWKKEANTYEGYYYVEYQISQCNEYGIPLAIPIRNDTDYSQLIK